MEERAFEILLSEKPMNRSGWADEDASQQHSHVKQQCPKPSSVALPAQVGDEMKISAKRDTGGFAGEETSIVKAGNLESGRRKEGVKSCGGEAAQASGGSPNGERELGGSGEEEMATRGGREVKEAWKADAPKVRMGRDEEEECNDLVRLWNERHASQTIDTTKPTKNAGMPPSSSDSAPSDSSSWLAPSRSSQPDGSRMFRPVSADADSTNARAIDRRVVNLGLRLRAQEAALTSEQEQGLRRIESLVASIARTNQVLAHLRRDLRCVFIFRCLCARARKRCDLG